MFRATQPNYFMVMKTKAKRSICQHTNTRMLHDAIVSPPANTETKSTVYALFFMFFDNESVLIL